MDQEDAKAAIFQPNLMNEEERASWKEYCDEVTHFFGEIVMRQSKKDKNEEL